MENLYTNEKHTQILIALLKAHGIKKVIASPGTTNITFIASIQHEPYFEIYSAADERSAAYIACGLSAESGEPVVLSCTGATASRNYVPGLTEAFYRKLPVLAITATQPVDRIGHNIAQVIDRRVQFNDLVKLSVQVSGVYNDDDKWACEIAINKAILELKHHGGGPVHINFTTTYSTIYDTKVLPKVNVIRRISYKDELPNIPEGKIGIFVGNHKKWNKELIEVVDAFCEKYNAIVFCDHTSKYKGKYRAFAGLIATQESYQSPCCFVDLMIHIGDISGAYMFFSPAKVWRVNPDGEVCDTFRKLQYTFEMEERDFFEQYVNLKEDKKENTFITEWKNEYEKIYNKIPELPFSNAWIAQNTISKLPENSILHLGILNTLRTWNYFEEPQSVLGYSNTGGFGIDGCVSSLIGASLGEPNKLFFGVVGDLAFFYDMNSIGNRHVGHNVRLMVINNGRGTEFRNYGHIGHNFGEDADKYIAAAGHYGRKSHLLLKHYAEDLGFEYLSASNKEEYFNNLKKYLEPKITDRPILFEVFTDSNDESEAIRIMKNIEISAKGKAKKVIKSVIGEQGVNVLKKLIKK
ncbi:thiamine pyrophosphate-binding protein [Megamonas hypermegale]|uniref:thiamine pyrophosphate-binding protein n=1 Tax=Megamonas hypermegale TaxID=158847 RepID=UPI0032099734